jgi:hypothetical protein
MVFRVATGMMFHNPSNEGDVEGVPAPVPSEHPGLPRNAKFCAEIAVGVQPGDVKGNKGILPAGHDPGHPTREIGVRVPMEFIAKELGVDAVPDARNQETVPGTRLGHVNDLHALLSESLSKLVLIAVVNHLKFSAPPGEKGIPGELRIIRQADH